MNTETQEPSEVTPPKPSWPLIVFSVINTLLAAAAVSLALLGFESAWPNSLSYFMLQTIVFGVLLIGTQYWGTFRASAGAALGAVVMTEFCYCWFWISYFAKHLVEKVVSGSSPEMLSWGINWSLILIVATTSPFVILNGVWYWKLNKHAKNYPRPRDFSISIREVLVFCSLMGLIILPTAYQSQANQSTYRENIAAAAATFPIPAQAKAIRYQRLRDGSILASYEIDEVGLRRWLSQPESELRKNKGRWGEIMTPVVIYLPDPDLNPLLKELNNCTVSNGIRCYWDLSGVRYLITYDRSHGLAFYQEISVSEK